MLLAALISATSTSSAALAATSTHSFSFVGTFRPVLLDEGLPLHPREHGRTQLGATLEAAIVYRPGLAELEVGAGALARLPFALNFSEELAAAPLVWAELTPIEGSRLRLGSLRRAHGHHRSVFDEERARYGRNLSALYLRALHPSVERTLDDDPALGSQNGAEVFGAYGPLDFDAYLDWQLLETSAHREKLTFGAVARATSTYLFATTELRIAHYGGQLFTRSDPIRFAGSDPVRQPTTYAATIGLTPLAGPISLELTGTIVHAFGVLVERSRTAGGRSGLEPITHRTGVEPRVELGFERSGGPQKLGLEMSWSMWLPDSEGFFGEEGDPIYSGPQSHRVGLSTSLDEGTVTLRGRVEVIFPSTTSEVQYLALTALELRFEAPLWTSSR
ncbi:MAG: hypothetical protein HYV07_03595 [Deltaproteobacteria bacterium]|nr:hypothetical protein [Deltaproteobacteria bacterium]